MLSHGIFQIDLVLQHINRSLNMGEAIKKWLKLKKELTKREETVLNISIAAHLIEGNVEKMCSKYGITGGQYNVLRILKGKYPGGHPRCEIISRMIERAPDITRLIDRLVKMKLAERVKSDNDRRLSVTKITSKGMKLINSMQPEIEKKIRSFTLNITEEECKKLSVLTEKLYAHLI